MAINTDDLRVNLKEIETERKSRNQAKLFRYAKVSR